MPTLDLWATLSSGFQVDGVQGYDEDQIALVIPDLSNFVARIPFILGTPTFSCIINIMKEKEIDTLVMT